ncbi:MAG: PP2C family protein-serine/threonine phosphatase [Phycisphaerales bacterium]
MSADQPQARESLEASSAFRAAVLRNEARRAYVVVVIVLVIFVSLVVLGGAPDSTPDVIIHVGLAAAGALLLVQGAVIWEVRRARRRERAGGHGEFPLWFAAATVILESLVPTAAILAHIRIGVIGPYAALSAPPVLVYGLLCGLTTLRLRPWLCMLSGTVAAAGYVAMVAYVEWGVHAIAAKGSLDPAGYVMMPMLIFASGVGAAWVAKEIRTYVSAALREARTRAHAERLERDIEVARSIQQALLPRRAPSVRGFDIAGWNRPADETGGDYFDWQQVSDGEGSERWIITLADVCGHGIGPALVTAACRAYVRASATHHADLESLATRINRLLSEDLPDGRFVTMASVLLNPPDGRVALLSAGHGPIVLYVKSTGRLTDVLPRDVPLAIVPEQEFGPAELFGMEAGDVLALVTDGFVEWCRQAGGARREAFGIDRLRESLSRHAGLRAEEIIRAVADDVRAFAGGDAQQDDLTMVIIKRT